jgi:hypothetical protein
MTIICTDLQLNKSFSEAACNRETRSILESLKSDAEMMVSDIRLKPESPSTTPEILLEVAWMDCKGYSKGTGTDKKRRRSPQRSIPNKDRVMSGLQI